jgi:N-acetylglutamate synthase-like GNAT family acetyltransferase
MEDLESERTGVSEITGNIVRISHASEADMGVIKEAMEREGLDTIDLRPEEFVIAMENGQLVGFGRIRKSGDIGAMGCAVLAEGEKKHGIGHLIADHLVRYASVDKIYVMADQADYFRRLGFQETDPSDRKVEFEIACAMVEKGEDRVLMVKEEKADEHL